MSEKNKDNMSFLDHLEDLRWHLVRSALAVVIIAFGAFFMKGFIFDKIVFGPKKVSFPTYRFLCNMSQRLHLDESLCIKELPFLVQSRTMAGQFSAHIWMAIWVGIILGFPYIVYEIWKFISPGLYAQERQKAKGFIVVSSLLFFSGVLFGYYVICPLSINFLANYTASNEIQNNIDLSSYISLVKTSALSCGLVFELPIIIYFLTKVGIVTPDILKKYRKHALVIVLILSAVITPPDITSQIIVSIPILILYELSIIISKYITKSSKDKKENTMTKL